MSRTIWEIDELISAILEIRQWTGLLCSPMYFQNKIILFVIFLLYYFVLVILVFLLISMSQPLWNFIADEAVGYHWGAAVCKVGSLSTQGLQSRLQRTNFDSKPSSWAAQGRAHTVYLIRDPPTSFLCELGTCSDSFFLHLCVNKVHCAYFNSFINSSLCSLELQARSCLRHKTSGDCSPESWGSQNTGIRNCVTLQGFS